MRVWGYHAVNVVLHAIVSCLVVLTCQACFTCPSAAMLLVAGLAFALHPAHTEAVSGLVGRAEILSGLFFLLSLLAYRRAAGNAMWVFPSVALAAAAALCKEQGVTVVGVACVYDLFVLARFDARQWLWKPSAATAARTAVAAAAGSKKAQKAAARAAAMEAPPMGAFGLRMCLLWACFGVFMAFRLGMNSVHIDVRPCVHV